MAVHLFWAGIVAPILGIIAAVDTSDPVLGALVSYGVAAPVVLILYRQAAEAKARADATEAKNQALMERMLEQQAAALPVLTEAVAVIKVTADRGK